MIFDLITILILVIISIVSIIAGVISATIYRRASKKIKYKALDGMRNVYSRKITEYFESGDIHEKIVELTSKINSTKWHAIEEIMLDIIADKRYENDAKRLFVKMGYADYYEKRLRKKNVIQRASAIDKLGKMRCGRATEKLIPLLKDENPEIVTVTVRSLSKIGSPIGLRSILDGIPKFLSRPLVTVKTIETSLANFGKAAIPSLVEYCGIYPEPMCKALVLEILSALNAVEAVPLALSNLSHQDPEVRSKALKIIGAVGDGLQDSDIPRVAGLLSDPVWFVRLQAARALGNMRREETIDKLGDALLDSNWQVRNAAAMALTKFGNRSLHVFLGTLLYKDRYAKESICEEIQRTDFIDALFGNLNSKDICVYKKSRQILEIMNSLGYCTPFHECINTGTEEKIKYELEIILSQEQPPPP